MDAGTLHRAIAEVCPVIGVSIGDADNRGTWTYQADVAATQPEKDAADNVIQTIPVATVPPAQAAVFVARFTDAEYLLLKQTHQTQLAANDASSIRIWDAMLASSTLNMNTPQAQALKADLVADGILTQVRADEIFGGAAPAVRGTL